MKNGISFILSILLACFCGNAGGTDADAAGETGQETVNPSYYLCRPCISDDDCSYPDFPEMVNICVDFKSEGSFCGLDCGSDSCPEGFACKEIIFDSKIFRQCYPENGKCECSEEAVAEEAYTVCSVSNGFGTCKEKRQCTIEGLSSCNAPEPSAEKCDKKDNDCNGQTDEGKLCEDSNPCTINHRCENGICLKDSVICNDKNICTDEKCDSETGECVFAFNIDPCETDGDPCTKDICSQGTCNHIKMNDNDPCDDGDKCTEADFCLNSICMAGKTVACSDDNECTDDSCDSMLGCLFSNKENGAKMSRLRRPRNAMIWTTTATEQRMKILPRLAKHRAVKELRHVHMAHGHHARFQSCWMKNVTEKIMTATGKQMKMCAIWSHRLMHLQILRRLEMLSLTEMSFIRFLFLLEIISP
jgi:hypothetical protein